MEQNFDFYSNYFVGKFYELTTDIAVSHEKADERASQAAAIYLALLKAGHLPAYSLERTLCVLQNV